MTHEEITSMEAHDILREVLSHGDHKALQRFLHVSPTLLYGWTILPKRDGGEGELNPIERFCGIVETLRTLGNPNAEELVQYVNDRLGYVAYRPDPDTADDGHMQQLMREMAEAFEAKAAGEKDGWEPEDWERFGREMSDVAQEAASYSAYATRQAATARKTTKQLPLLKPRPFVRMNR